MQQRHFIHGRFPTVCLACAVFITTHSLQAHAPRAVAEVAVDFGKVPLHFEANHGQAGDDHAFLSRGNGYRLLISPTESRLVLLKPAATDPANRRNGKFEAGKGRERVATSVRVQIEGADPSACIEGVGARQGRVNYLVGNDRSRQRTGIPTCSQVRVEDVYPGIDLVHYGNQRQLEFDFVVAAGVDPNVIGLRIEGAESVRVNEAGDLVLSVDGGEVALQSPVAYQVQGGVRSRVVAQYVIETGNRVRFAVGAYDPGRELVIDPIIEYSSFLGGNVSERGSSIAVDATGVYVVGQTDSDNFPDTEGVEDRSYNGGIDSFLTKFTLDGTDLIFSTFLGGEGDDNAFAVVVDGTGHPYVVGATTSDDFPTTSGAHDRSHNGGQDGFVTKFMPDGSDFVYSTYLGGDADDAIFAVALDSEDRPWLTGQTKSDDFPTTTGADDRSHNGMYDAFVTRLNEDGSDYDLSTFLGDVNDDAGTGIALGPNERPFVCGWTQSDDFPTTQGAHDRSLDGSGDAFVTRYMPDISDIEYSTYLGGSSDERAFAIVVNMGGEAFVTGYTQSIDFKNTSVAVDKDYNKLLDAFMTRFNADGTDLLYSTFLGGAGDDIGYAIALWEPATVYLTGETTSKNFKTTKGAPATEIHKGADAFVSKIDTDASVLLYSTYLGGKANDFGFDLALDMMGNAFVTGQTSSTNLDELDDRFDESLGGLFDAYVTKVAEYFGDGHDVAVTEVSPSSKIKLSDKKPSDTGKVKVTVQNRSQHDEFLVDQAMVEDLISLTVDSLGACPDLVPVFHSINLDLPAQISPGQEFSVEYDVTFDCVNDPLKASKKDPTHADFRYIATVDHAALDGEPDDHTADDICPRDPLGVDTFPDGSINDKGCGGQKADKTLGADVYTDIQFK